jgi:hypothetical protein
MDAVLRMDDRGLTPRIRMLLHDEVVMSVPTSEYDEYRIAALDCMTTTWTPHGSSRGVPITAAGGRPGESWAAAYEKASQ